MLEKRFSKVQVLFEFFNMTLVTTYNDHPDGEQASPLMMMSILARILFYATPP